MEKNQSSEDKHAAETLRSFNGGDLHLSPWSHRAAAVSEKETEQFTQNPVGAAPSETDLLTDQNSQDRVEDKRPGGGHVVQRVFRWTQTEPLGQNQGVLRAWTPSMNYSYM